MLKWGIICSIPSEKREWFNGAGNYVLNVVQSGIDANVSDDAKTMLIESKVRELYEMLEDVSLSNKKQSLITKFFN